MVTILTGLFAGLVVLSVSGMTAIDFGTAEGIGTMLCLALMVALVVISGFFRMHHWRITIKTPKEPEYMIYELSAKPRDQRLLFQIQDKIMSRAGMQGEPVRKKSKKLVPAIVISALVLVLAAFVAFQELYQIRALPEKVLSDKETRATAWVEMRGDLVPGDCDIIAEITGGRLAKPTAVPRYEDGSFLYQYVKYIYDITLSNSDGGSTSGTVTATVGFSVKPFHNQLEAILFDSFTYSDELVDFVAQQQTLPDILTGYWIYDPDDLISAAVEEEILAYNTTWDKNYQSVTAVAAIEDALEANDVETYALDLGNKWGLGENDMLLLIYDNGDACFWICNQVMEATFGADGLDDVLDKFEENPWDDSGDSALLNFFAALDGCYAIVYADNSVEAPVFSEMAKAYIGTWENVSDSACLMEVSPQPVDGYFSVEINWWVGTQYCITWTYAGVYNDDTGGIDCYHGSRSDFYKDGEAPYTDDVYIDTGEATLYLLNDDYLEWTNLSEDMEANFPDMLFNFRRVTTQ